MLTVLLIAGGCITLGLYLSRAHDDGRQVLVFFFSMWMGIIFGALTMGVVSELVPKYWVTKSQTALVTNCEDTYHPGIYVIASGKNYTAWHQDDGNCKPHTFTESRNLMIYQDNRSDGVLITKTSTCDMPYRLFAVCESFYLYEIYIPTGGLTR